jgi:hypothetical protein
MLFAVVMPDTMTVVLKLEVVVLSPSWPLALEPQHSTVPFFIFFTFRSRIFFWRNGFGRRRRRLLFRHRFNRRRKRRRRKSILRHSFLLRQSI